MALLALVFAAWPEHREQLFVLHYDHHTRAGASAEDAAFVTKAAESLRLRIASGRREAGGAASEAALREQRLAFFHDSMRAAGARMLLTAHQRDDVAESMLMRLMRGSGLQGLSAPRPVQRYGTFLHVRPLLNLPKAALVEALLDAGVDWREDASNAEDAFLRNRIRSHVIPELNRLGDRDFSGGAARARRLLEEAAEVLEWAAERACPEANRRETLPVDTLRELPVGCARWIIERWLTGRGVRKQVEASLLDKALAALHAGESFGFSLDASREWISDACTLSIRQRESLSGRIDWPVTVLCPGVRVFLPDGRSLRVELVRLDASRRNGILRGEVNVHAEAWLSSPASCLFVRNVRPGDRYRALGSPGTRKLQDIFTDAHIERHQRPLLPVITDEQGEILWCVGFPPADAARLDGSTTEALRLTCLPICSTVNP